jgi:hypothetical protein
LPPEVPPLPEVAPELPEPEDEPPLAVPPPDPGDPAFEPPLPLLVLVPPRPPALEAEPAEELVPPLPALELPPEAGESVSLSGSELEQAAPSRTAKGTSHALFPR